MKTISMFCEQCGEKTLHVEDSVPDSESATVWHCLVCGREQRPKLDGGDAVAA